KHHIDIAFVTSRPTQEGKTSWDKCQTSQPTRARRTAWSLFLDQPLLPFSAAKREHTYNGDHRFGNGDRHEYSTCAEPKRLCETISQRYLKQPVAAEVY